MAEGILKAFDKDLQVYSAGTEPAIEVHPKAIMVLMEIGIDISNNKPKSVERFLNDSFDYVITVCDNAKETCPVFTGKVEKRLHIGFEDPSGVTGSEEEVINEFRKTRDQIKEKFSEIYQKELKKKRGIR